MKSKTLKYINGVIKQKGAAFSILLDPDKFSADELGNKVKNYEQNGVDFFLVGGSLMMVNNFHQSIQKIKNSTKLPVIIFPGSSSHLSPYADAVLFISLISGRNPNYLFGEHVLSAPIIKDMGIEAISAGYVLIESGTPSAVEIISNTRPIPRQKIKIVMAHALAAEYLGMDFVYLEAGSGAKESVPDEMIDAVRNYIDIPLIVGGGIKTPDDAKLKVNAGASIVVIGNMLEQSDKTQIIKEFADAIHYK
ncbi:geranylgeranylglyceryl/heptaprenylglyceryl phosphate synthase [candidate division KSB1 bacterium]